MGRDEESTGPQDYLQNTTVESFSWKSLDVMIHDKAYGGERPIISNVQGRVNAGEVLAIMGPSGCGKTTLLDKLAYRKNSKYKLRGDIFVNDVKPSGSAFRKLSSYVEQEDSLIGSLTAKETLYFAAKLALPSSVGSSERMRRIETLLASFGLRNEADTIIGTPLRKGLSGGQKRRVGVSSALVTCPKILFLDEPTSGLDSSASYEVMSYLKQVAKANLIIVIASIHQPSTSTFALFDKLLLLSAGRTCYFGTMDHIGSYFQSIGYPVPLHYNPAEYLLELVSVDFATDSQAAKQKLAKIHSAWSESSESKSIFAEPKEPRGRSTNGSLSTGAQAGPTKTFIPLTLLHRNFIKSYRDVVAYGIRLAMYTGLAIMMGTVWLRLGATQETIQPFINAIFFGSAFMSFMAVAYVPAYLEDRATFVKERANGLYGPASFLIANFLIGLPYLFIFSALFSIIAYWLSNFQPTAHAFFTWVMWLFLDLVAAESLVVFMSSVFPNFVVALALVAFANGLWMSVGGFLVTPTILNVFYHYVFSYIDYQAYVFQGMMVNEFSDRIYSCGPPPCVCMYQTELADQCLIAGQGVLDAYGYGTGNTGKWVGILLGIVLGYRLLAYLVLLVRRS